MRLRRRVATSNTLESNTEEDQPRSYKYEGLASGAHPSTEFGRRNDAGHTRLDRLGQAKG